MKNPWIALLATMVVSTSGLMIMFSNTGWWALRNYIAILKACGSFIGLKPPASFTDIPFATALHWFYPFALRLGWHRALAWIGLVGISTVLSEPLRMNDTAHLPVLLVPCLAMIGRRSRPWMATPAALAFLAVVTLSDENGNLTRRLACASLPYAAILIFGTKLIPKQPAPAAPCD